MCVVACPLFTENCLAYIYEIRHEISLEQKDRHSPRIYAVLYSVYRKEITD